MFLFACRRHDGRCRPACRGRQGPQWRCRGTPRAAHDTKNSNQVPTRSATAAAQHDCRRTGRDPRSTEESDSDATASTVRGLVAGYPRLPGPGDRHQDRDQVVGTAYTGPRIPSCSVACEWITAPSAMSSVVRPKENRSAKSCVARSAMSPERSTRPSTPLDKHERVQGSQYACEQFQKLLADHGIEYSMNRPGERHDNAVMESFFSRMKEDRVSRRRYRTRDEARADIFDYIERFYNPKRRHSTLGGLSPVEYEKRAKSA